MNIIQKIIKKLSIHLWLQRYGVKNYNLVPDAQYGLVVDVAGDVDLRRKKLTSIPVKFNVVSGSFSCGYNMLKTLEGVPKLVGEHFFCGNNELSSLLGCPTTIGGTMDITSNQLSSLEHAPKIITAHFNCAGNQLKNLDFMPEVEGHLFLSNNPSLGHYQECTSMTQIREEVDAFNLKNTVSQSICNMKKSTVSKL